MSDLEVTRLDRDLVLRAKQLLDLCQEKGLTVVTAESCTGGLVAAVLTEAPGSSKVVEGGFVTYSNHAKKTCLGVPQDLLEKHGAVSAPVARAMAEGALRGSEARLSVSITGIAGPAGGTEEKPVGLVHFGAMRRGEAPAHRERRYGDIGRAGIRRASILDALDFLEDLARQP